MLSSNIKSTILAESMSSGIVARYLTNCISSISLVRVISLLLIRLLSKQSN